MIKIEGLKKTYDKNTRHANEVLHDISLTLPDTGFVCILGQSGCGKTSLLNAIGGLDLFDRGVIETDTAKITHARSKVMERERNSSFGYIFQNYYLLSEHSAAYNVYLGMHSMPLSEKEKKDRVKDALRRVDMLRYRKRPVSELSGGQRQRVAIARAIARHPKVIFADEPTGNLDEANTLNICSILKELSRDSLVVMVTHEERIARFFADRIITLDAGNIISDSTDWSRSSMDFGDKDTLYKGDYSCSDEKNDSFSLKLMHKDGADPLELTIVIDNDRIIIKHNDPRVILCSKENDPPYIKDGKRPKLVYENLSASPDVPAKKEKNTVAKERRARGPEFSLLFKEAIGLTAGKKMRKFGTGIFIILLSLMLSVTVADAITVASIDPEDFITTDSHLLTFRVKIGTDIMDMTKPVSQYRSELKDFLNASGCDFDYFTINTLTLVYVDHSIPQIGNLPMSFDTFNRAEISRLDESDLISGRMPERYDEIVLDRFELERILAEDGILQNIIPSCEYFIGKKLIAKNKSTELTVVGISDSGEPSMYMSREAILAFSVCGTEVITLSEYKKLTGDTSLDLKGNQCVALLDNATALSSSWNQISLYIGSNYGLELVEMISDTDDSIGAKIIITDESLDPLYRSMIDTHDDFFVWCSDKEALLSYYEDNLPKDISRALSIVVEDKYSDDYKAYEERTATNVDSRMIVTVSVITAAVVMLYLMQRSKIKDRMDLVAVYRLLGIRKSALAIVFMIENLIITLKYSLPSVGAMWILFNLIPSTELYDLSGMLFPLWAALAVFFITALFGIIAAILPLLRLLRQPPARLASKYDF